MTTRTAHRWTDADDAALAKAVEDCADLFNYYRGQGKTYSTRDVWSAIAGRLVPGIVVTGKAARRHWEILQQRREAAEAAAEPESPPAENQWDAVAQKVADHDRDLNERNADALEGLRADVARLAKMIEAIGRELGVTP